MKTMLWVKTSVLAGLLCIMSTVHADQGSNAKFNLVLSNNSTIAGGGPTTVPSIRVKPENYSVSHCSSGCSWNVVIDAKQNNSDLANQEMIFPLGKDGHDITVEFSIDIKDSENAPYQHRFCKVTIKAKRGSAVSEVTAEASTNSPSYSCNAYVDPYPWNCEKTVMVQVQRK